MTAIYDGPVKAATVHFYEPDDACPVCEPESARPRVDDGCTYITVKVPADLRLSLGDEYALVIKRPAS